MKQVITGHAPIALKSRQTAPTAKRLPEFCIPDDSRMGELVRAWNLRHDAAGFDGKLQSQMEGDRRSSCLARTVAGRLKNARPGWRGLTVDVVTLAFAEIEEGHSADAALAFFQTLIQGIGPGRSLSDPIRVLIEFGYRIAASSQPAPDALQWAKLLLSVWEATCAGA